MSVVGRAALAAALLLPYVAVGVVWSARASSRGHDVDSNRPSAANEQGIQIALVHSLDGVVEPCGCGGERVGGIAAVVDTLRALHRQPGPPLVVVDGGDAMPTAPGPWHALVPAVVDRSRERSAPVLACLGEQDLPYLHQRGPRHAPLACLNLGTGADPRAVVPWHALDGGVLVTSIIDPALAAPDKLEPLSDAWRRFERVVESTGGVGICFLHVAPRARRVLLRWAARSAARLLLVDGHDRPAIVSGVTKCGTSAAVLRTLQGGREIAVLHLPTGSTASDPPGGSSLGDGPAPRSGPVGATGAQSGGWHVEVHRAASAVGTCQRL